MNPEKSGWWWLGISAVCACIASVASESHVSAIDLQQAKGAIVTVQIEGTGPAVARNPYGDPWGLRLRQRGPGGGFDDWPQPPGQSFQQVTGFRLQAGDTPLILSLLDHAVRRSESLRVVLEAGVPERATVRAWDPASGLVVLQLSAAGEEVEPSTGETGAAPLALAETAAAWGEPLQVLSQWRPGSPAISAGVVSTETHFDQTLGVEVFQTDAVADPSSRGAPVVNGAGEVVGVVAAIRGASDAQGLAIAAGLDTIRQLVNFVSDGGTGALPRARIGVALRTSPTGVIIRSVIDGSPAQRAGVEAGDRVVSIDQQPVRQYEEVMAIIRAKRPGDTLELTVDRDGQTEQLTVTLDEMPEQEAAATGGPPDAVPDPQLTPETLRRWLEQQGLTPTPIPGGAASPAPSPPGIPTPPPLPEDLSGKLDALSEQLRELNEQVRQMREQQPE